MAKVLSRYHWRARALSASLAQLISSPNDAFGTLWKVDAEEPAGVQFDVPMSRRADEPARKLIVEGWRFVAHSYAIVNQWQLLALSKRRDLSIKIRDLPFYREWPTQMGLFGPDRERILQSFEIAEPNEAADVTLRVGFPFDLSPAKSGRTAVFATAEDQNLEKKDLADPLAFGSLRDAAVSDLKIITPSRWSAEGFYKAGFSAEQVAIIPHGVDTEGFHPSPDGRVEARARLGLAADEFAFLSVGAMTWNKGIDVLLTAFGEVLAKYPRARLILKGLDPLYASRNRLLQAFCDVPRRLHRRVAERTLYLGESIPFWKLARLYQAADAYVSPYRAEGFNMPVLEAAACGLPVICTKGGPTDDFVSTTFARQIDSETCTSRVDDRDRTMLAPSVEHLISLMTSMIEDGPWRMRAAELGPRHVRQGFTWDDVTARLLDALWS